MAKKDNSDNRANQHNPNNNAYWQARGYPQRPPDWQRRARETTEDDDWDDDDYDS